MIFVALGGASADELTGKQLAPVDSLTEALSTIFGNVLTPASERISGSFDAATATVSAERDLEVDLTYRGLAGAVVRAKVAQVNRAALPHVACAPAEVPAGGGAASGHLTLRCALQPTAPEGYTASSAYLILEAAKVGRTTPQIVRGFALPKTWRQVIAPENVVVDVTPRPVGQTAAYVTALTAPTHPIPMVLVPVRPAVATIAQPMIMAPAATAVQPRERISTNVTLRERNREVVEALPNSRVRVPVGEFGFATAPPPATDPNAPTQKISAFTVDLLDRVDTAGVEVARDELLRIFENVFRDENPQSGVFYFVPRGYRLAWDRTTGGSRGLGMRMSYQRLSGDAANNSVRMALTLDAGVDLVERAVARELLAMQARQAPTFKFVELRAFPLAAPPAVSLRNDLQYGYDISGDRIGVVALTDALAQIDVSWTTDTVTTQNMRLALREGMGLAGTIQFSPVNAGGPSPLIPIHIRLDDPETYGTIAWSRTEEMRNHTPFSLRLQTLHALVIQGDQARILSWDLGAAAVPPKARIRVALDQLPAAVDGAAKRMWIRYAIDRDCQNCVGPVIDDLLSGDVWPDTSRVTVRMLTPIADTGAAELWVNTRSRFFKTGGGDVAEGPRLVFTADRTEQVIEPVFGHGTTDEASDAPPLLEYLITLIMPDGSEHRGTTWIASRQDRILVGRLQAEKSLGSLPPHP